MWGRKVGAEDGGEDAEGRGNGDRAKRDKHGSHEHGKEVELPLGGMPGDVGGKAQHANAAQGGESFPHHEADNEQHDRPGDDGGTAQRPEENAVTPPSEQSIDSE